MNKKFYLALAATAALFASCSSDDVAQAPALSSPAISHDGAINLSIANAQSTTTRGTGTVGSADENEDQWAGQKVNIYMLKTGTLDLAYELKEDGTDDTTKPLFDNQEMKVEQNSAALVLDIDAVPADASWKERTVTNKYFPGSGVFDFWGYRTDGAETAAPVDGATAKTIAFEIDGSQDLMSGKAVPLAKSADPTAYGHYNSAEDAVYGRYGGADVNVALDKIYSAYSARREIDPIMHFNHQLARFTFQVKGANIAACIEEGETSPEKKEKAVNVTQVKVTSKYKGDLVIAYTGATAPDPITWNDATTSLYLKQRAQKVTAAATGDFYAIKVNRGADDAGSNPTYSYTVATAVAPAAPSVNNATLINGAAIDNDTKVYDAYSKDATTGLPTGTPTTIGDIKTALAENASSDVFYRYFPNTDVYYSNDPADIDLTADLVDLQPVQPTYTAPSTINKVKVGEALLLPADVNEYKLEVTLTQSVTQTTKKVVDANGHQIYVNDVTTPTQYYLYVPAVVAADAVYTTTDLYDIPAGCQTAANAAGVATALASAAAGDYDFFTEDDKAYKTYTWDGSAVTATSAAHYTEPAGVTAVADADALTTAAKALAATGDKVYKVGTAKYVNVNVTKAAVAAADAYWYEKSTPATHITVAAFEAGITAGTYKEWKTEVNVPKTQLVKQTIKLPNNPSTGAPMSFEAGKTYNVVLTVNGVEAIGGEGTQQPIVDVWVENAGDIELDDNTEE